MGGFFGLEVVGGHGKLFENRNNEEEKNENTRGREVEELKHISLLCILSWVILPPAQPFNHISRHLFFPFLSSPKP